jgi:two-component system, cell cycle sensor histidine kinase and response regulator CckA
MARILIVDDEPGIRLFTERALRQVGHVTATAADGPEALRVAETFAPFELLLTDLRMPEMSGDDLARLIRQRLPDVKVLYLTGYSDQLFKTKGTLWAGEAFLDKPSTIKGLLEAVSLLLDGTPSPPT